MECSVNYEYDIHKQYILYILVTLKAKEGILLQCLYLPEMDLLGLCIVLFHFQTFNRHLIRNIIPK